MWQRGVGLHWFGSKSSVIECLCAGDWRWAYASLLCLSARWAQSSRYSFMFMHPCNAACKQAGTHACDTPGGMPRIRTPARLARPGSRSLGLTRHQDVPVESPDTQLLGWASLKNGAGLHQAVRASQLLLQRIFHLRLELFSMYVQLECSKESNY